MDQDDGQRHKRVFYELQGFYSVTLIHHSNVCLLVFRFLYSDEVQIGPETVMTTLYTAKKYAVPALEAHCVEFLKKNLRADNAFMLLTQVSLSSSAFSKVQHRQKTGVFWVLQSYHPKWSSSGSFWILLHGSPALLSRFLQRTIKYSKRCCCFRSFCFSVAGGSFQGVSWGWS